MSKKFKIRKTGEIIEVISFVSTTTRDKNDSVSYIDSNGNECNSSLNYYWDLEEINSEIDYDSINLLDIVDFIKSDIRCRIIIRNTLRKLYPGVFEVESRKGYVIKDIPENVSRYVEKIFFYLNLENKNNSTLFITKKDELTRKITVFLGNRFYIRKDGSVRAPNLLEFYKDDLKFDNYNYIEFQEIIDKIVEGVKKYGNFN